MAGWACLLIGVIGLFLPVLQGWLFISIGAVLLAPDIALFRKLECWVERRFPMVRGALSKLRVRLGRPAASPCEPPEGGGPEV